MNPHQAARELEVALRRRRDVVSCRCVVPRDVPSGIDVEIKLTTMTKQISTHASRINDLGVQGAIEYWIGPEPE